jgi:hypothetical protein
MDSKWFDSFIEKLLNGDNYALGLFCLVIGLALVVISLSPQLVEWVSKKIPKMDSSEPLILSLGQRIGLGLFGLIIFIIGFLFLIGLENILLGVDKLKSYIPITFAEFILLATIAFILSDIHRLHKSFKRIVDDVQAICKGTEEARIKLLADVESAHQEMKSSVLDSTRNTLVGFPQILDKALAMLSAAQNDITFICFNMNFGEPHEKIDDICKQYVKLPITEAYRIRGKNERNFSKDVDDFYEQLLDKAGRFRHVHILSLTDDNISKDFLGNLACRQKYMDIYKKEQITAKKVSVKKTGEVVDFCEIGKFINKAKYHNTDDEYLIEEVNLIYKEYMEQRITHLKKRLLNKMRDARHNLRFPDSSGKFLKTASLPIQILITDKGRSAESSAQYACLVFLVGSDVMRGSVNRSEEIIELGFYTELQQVVQIYRNLAESLFKQAERPDQDIDSSNCTYSGD